MRPLRPASGWPVRDVCSKLGVTIDDASRAAIDAWLDALAEWNAKMDLTAAKDARALVWLMLADALVLSRAIARDASPNTVTVIDVGSGAGAPGLALALLRRDLRVTLCEPLKKRAAFLRTVIGALGLAKDVALEPKRGEDLEKHRWDVAISRATLAPAEWLALGASLVRPRGEVWVLLAQEDAPMREGCDAIETLAYDDDVTGAKKKLVRYAVNA